MTDGARKRCAAAASIFSERVSAGTWAAVLSRVPAPVDAKAHQRSLPPGERLFFACADADVEPVCKLAIGAGSWTV
jgi:hypothetical protein